MKFEAECARLESLLDNLPDKLPISPPNSKLPPRLDFAFLEEEGAWPAFNKAMHASFGDKANGLKIDQRGPALTETVSLVRWCLGQLNKAQDSNSAELVNLWIMALISAAEGAGAKVQDVNAKVPTIESNRPRRAHQPNRQMLLREEAADANSSAKSKAEQTNEKRRPVSKWASDSDDSVKAAMEPKVVDHHQDKSEAADGLYIQGDTTESSSDGDSSDDSICNTEIAGILPRKTIPQVITRMGSIPAAREAAQVAQKAIKDQRHKTKRKRKTSKGNLDMKVGDPSKSGVEAVEPMAKKLKTSGDNHANQSQLEAAHVEGIQDMQPAPGVRFGKSPIYAFFELVDTNASGEAGAEGDKHYRCYHGKQKILTVTKKMKSSQNGLINHLRSNFPDMFRLYENIKSREGQRATLQEAEIAANKISLDSKVVVDYLKSLESKPGPLVEAFGRQGKREAAWDQRRFNELLTTWLVSCDHPFEEVEKPEFRAMMEYTHGSLRPLELPSATTMKRRVMKLHETVQQDMKSFIAALDGKISLSLDAWSSSNGYAFLAIVMHYISHEWKLEEVLIDFRELIGDHSGKNMAAAVLETWEVYNLKGRVQAIVSDNATNNDTMMLALQQHCSDQGIEFSATDARMRCMPHTVHLAALKLLQGLGALSLSQGHAAENMNYQDSVTLPVDRHIDNEAVAHNDTPEQDSGDYDGVSGSVNKIRKIVRAIRASPQRRRLWLDEVNISFRNSAEEPSDVAKMLILDVKTRWASTHQMLRRALEYQTQIDNYVAKMKELRAYEMTSEDWSAVELVTRWLRCFREATTQMSATKHSTLSSTHGVFKGLQDELAANLAQLPEFASSELRDSLVNAHRKLSDYFYKFDKSPYYIWAALLDPRIGYLGLQEDYSEDNTFLSLIEEFKTSLELHYSTEYANHIHVPPKSQESHELSAKNPRESGAFYSPGKMNFTARYRKRAPSAQKNELNEFFNLPMEEWETCDPVQWWGARKAQFPNLSRLARDIMTIPGSAVAVERIFSGGRDTISLRRASLKPDTIRALMILKQQLKLAKVKIDAVLND